MIHHKIILISAIGLLSFSSFCQKWELKKDEGGVKVYTRHIEGSNILEFKGEVTVKSNMSAILTMLDSVSEYPKWMENCTKSEWIKRINKASGYSYYVIDAPWPISDRDACTYFKVVQDTHTLVITVSLKGVKNYIPEKSGRVRIPSLNGFWQLTPISKDQTKIVYQVHCDIGGSVPAVLVNAYITDTPFSNLTNIKNIVESTHCPKTIRKDIRELK